MVKKKKNKTDEPLEKQLWKSAENIFFVPTEAPWNFLLSQANNLAQIELRDA